MLEKLWLKILSRKKNILWWPLFLPLLFLSVIYRLALCFRSSFVRPGVKLTAPVISIGNLTVGGAGKTPFAIMLAEKLLAAGKKVGLVSSGYGRRHTISLLGSGKEIAGYKIDDVGDEVMMMARRLPGLFFAIDSSKSRGATRLAEKFHPDVIIVDDAFQHWKLARDLDILLIDAGLDLRQEPLFPAGKRREPLAAINRADLVVATKINMFLKPDFLDWLGRRFSNGDLVKVAFHNQKIVSKEETVFLSEIRDKHLYFFAGVAAFDSLLAHLQASLPNLAGYHRFPDHCRYFPSERLLIEKDITRLQPELTFTTAKDFVKLGDFDPGCKLYYLDLELEIVSGEEKLQEKIREVTGS
jgi:tetraacyldisaccharide 4'-kinase